MLNKLISVTRSWLLLRQATDIPPLHPTPRDDLISISFTRPFTIIMNLIWILAFLGAFATSVGSLAPQRQVLIIYPTDTPQATLNEYRSTIIAAGGEILHEFNLIKYDVEKNA